VSGSVYAQKYPRNDENLEPGGGACPVIAEPISPCCVQRTFSVDRFRDIEACGPGRECVRMGETSHTRGARGVSLDWRWFPILLSVFDWAASGRRRGRVFWSARGTHLVARAPWPRNNAGCR
jgi:hypothetical protein